MRIEMLQLGLLVVTIALCLYGIAVELRQIAKALREIRDRMPPQ